MKFLLINPNTSEHVTARLADAARATLGGAAQVCAVTATSGPAIVGSGADNVKAAGSALALAAAHAPGCDAVILGLSTDAGLFSIRELLQLPAVGMLEASLHTACQLGTRVGLLTLGPQMLPLYKERAAAYGLASRVVGWAAPELPAAYGAAPGEEVFDAVADHAARLVQLHALDVLITCGAVLAGCRPRIEDRVPVPVVDALEAAVWQAYVMARLAPLPRRTGIRFPLSRE